MFIATNGSKLLPFTSAANANFYCKLWAKLENTSVEVKEQLSDGSFRTIAYYGAKA